MNKACLVGAASLAALSWSAVAQDGSSGEYRDDKQTDVISVLATRNPIPAFEYPGQVTVLDRQRIDDFDPSSVSDLFIAIPGAQFDGGPRRSGETPSIRGLTGEGVLVYFDGARQSFLSGHDGRFFIDPELVRTVEVVRGPTSALYGSGALGGVVALRTITADDLLEGNAQTAFRLGAGYQGVNEETKLSAGGGWRNKSSTLDLVGNVTYRASGDIELGNDFTLPAQDEIYSYFLKGSARPIDALSVSGSWLRYDGDSVDPNNPQGANVAGPGNGLVDRAITSDTLQTLVNYAPEGSDLIDLNIVGYYTNNEVQEDERDSDRIISRAVATTGLSIDNRSRLRLGGSFDLVLTYGGEYYVDEQTGRDSATVDGTRGGVPDAESRFTGVFAQAEASLTNPLGAPGVLTIIPGARWDRFENEAVGEADTDDDAVSPKVGLSYRPVEPFLVFANYAEAFRAPSFNEIYADGIHFQIPDLSANPPFPPTFVTNFFIPNTELEPEESETWEVGAGFDLRDVVFANDRFTAKASYYQSDVSNLIDLEVNIPAGCFGAPFPPCGSGEALGNFSRNVNVTNAELDGVELEASYDARLVFARANYSAIDGVNADTGAFVGSLSPDIVFLDGGIKWPGADIRLGSRIVFASDFDDVNDPTLARDGYTVADLYAVWEPTLAGVSGLRFDVGVDNVTDENYEVVAAGVSQPGRNVKASISWRWGF